jgi:hypothetical protein
MKNFKSTILPIFIFAIFSVSFINVYAEEVIPDPIITPDPIVTPDPVVSPDPVIDPVSVSDPIVDPDPIADPDPVIDPNTNTQTPPPTPQENFIIRINDTVLFNGSVDLPASGTVSIIDSNSVAHDINSQSVLAILKSIDDANDSFAISNLTYYDSFGSFYLKCITPTSGAESCDNWQYAVGATTPFSSIETTILTGGETVGIYFGSSHRVNLDKNSINTNESLVANAETYDYQNNLWSPLSNVNIGVTLPNPNDPWNPNVVATYPVDSNGVANIAITNPNTYTVGIVEDYYFPSYSVVVTDVPINTGGNGNSNTVVKNFDINQAINYLTSNQNNDGSFGGNELYTDWALIGLSAKGIDSSAKNKALEYLKNKNKISNTLTDNERRAMAILALGEDPYDFDGTNYISAIIKDFDGVQFGDSSLVNDDIFALFPLFKSGYTTSDTEINKSIEFIISKQKSNGSWEDSVDMTSAGIQALAQFQSVSGVSSALAQASTYVQSMQQNNGGWTNVSSTAWAMQASSAIGANWSVGGKTGLDYLATFQQTDGGLLDPTESTQNRVWNTSYAIPAVAGKTWASIMQSVNKKKLVEEKTNDTKAEQEIKSEETKYSEINPEEEAQENIEILNTQKPPEIKKVPVAKTSAVVLDEKESVPEIPLTANLTHSYSPISTPYIFGGIALFLGIILGWRFLKKS